MGEIGVQCRDNRTYRFSPETTALLAIDLQQEFFTDGAGECVDEMRAILPRVATIIGLAREIGCKVIHTRESYAPDLSDVHAYRRSLNYVGEPGPLGRFCILGEPGHEFVDQVKPLPSEAVVDKAGFGAFYNSELDSLLRQDGIDHLMLCGVTIADCCAASDPGMHDAALKIIAGEGHLFGWVGDSQDVQEAISSYAEAT